MFGFFQAITDSDNGDDSDDEGLSGITDKSMTRAAQRRLKQQKVNHITQPIVVQSLSTNHSSLLVIQSRIFTDTFR